MNAEDVKLFRKLVAEGKFKGQTIIHKGETPADDEAQIIMSLVITGDSAKVVSSRHPHSGDEMSTIIDTNTLQCIPFGSCFTALYYERTIILYHT
jgi:hypothetical protein